MNTKRQAVEKLTLNKWLAAWCSSILSSIHRVAWWQINIIRQAVDKCINTKRQADDKLTLNDWLVVPKRVRARAHTHTHTHTHARTHARTQNQQQQQNKNKTTTKTTTKAVNVFIAPCLVVRIFFSFWRHWISCALVLKSVVKRPLATPKRWFASFFLHAPPPLVGPGLFCFTSTETRWLIRDGDMGWKEGERVKARPRTPPEKRPEETVDRRQNNGSVKAVSPRHFPAPSALRDCCFNCSAWAESEGQCPLHCCWGGRCRPSAQVLTL